MILHYRMGSLKEIIEMIWKDRGSVSDISRSREVHEIVDRVITDLDDGLIRVCEKEGETWKVNDWVRKAIMLYFLVERTQEFCSGFSFYYDKIAPKLFRKRKESSVKFRNVPPTMIRRGSYVADGAVLMPCFINIGAYVGSRTMIDAWSTIGSCAQIGDGVHISGGVGIGGVLEPSNARPVIIEDNCFIGARSEIAEGVIVERNSVISMGVFLGQSTRIYDRETARVFYGRVPQNSVVVPGSFLKNDKYGLNCAIIVKKVDELTRSKTGLNSLLRSGRQL